LKSKEILPNYTVRGYPVGQLIELARQEATNESSES
jgi:hypothetical protein